MSQSLPNHVPSCEKACVAIWFRSDLRTSDNQALWLACEAARAQDLPLRGFYIATPAQWQQHSVGPMQLDFIERSINQLQRALASLGIAFDLLHCDDFSLVNATVEAYCQRQGVKQIFAGREVEINEQRRDQALAQLTRTIGVGLQFTDEHCLLPPGSVRTQGGEMYRVFTPFFRRWRELLGREAITPLPVPAPLAPALPEPAELSFKVSKQDSKQDSHHWPVGEGAARQRLDSFIANQLADYGQERDFPALDGTSCLSPYLAFGILSPRQCVAALLNRFPEAMAEDNRPGRSWLAELAWREFYRHLLHAWPQLCMGRNFNVLGDDIVWRNDPQEFAAWCEGRTGYPLVDAAMRQLNQTGWMHNRLRMVTASFLTKHLLVDWRWGEQYFRRALIDGDLAANNGGWQWSAGTGCDAQPYFRIFNPMSQSEKFDPDASFIRRYLPELAHWPLKQIHHPGTAASSRFTEPSLFATAAYPPPIVEHSAARQRALTALAVLKKSA